MSQCPRGNRRNITHDALVLNYSQMFREADFITRTEPRNEFIHIDASAKQPDLLVYNFKGTIACFDVSGRPNPDAEAKSGEAADKREQTKYSKYKDIAKAAGMTFYPLVHKAHGRTGKSAQSVLKTCVSKIAHLMIRTQPVS